MIKLLCIFANALFLTYPSLVVATDLGYPQRPVRLIVPYPPGGNADFIARPLAQRLGEKMSQQVVIDNRGGAGGVIGESIAAKAAPDGYTMVFLAISHAVNPSLNARLPYSAADFDPVVQASRVPNMLVVYPQLPVRTVSELVKLAKNKPGKLNYGSSGNGTAVHLAAELFNRAADVEIVRVTYKGSAQVATDLFSGRVQIMFDVITNGIRNLTAGRVRALGVTSAKRSPAAPEIPSIAEFFPGYEMTSWQGLAVPVGTPSGIIAKLNAELIQILKSREISDLYLGSGAEPVGSTPEEFKALIRSETARWKVLLAQSGIKAQ